MAFGEEITEKTKTVEYQQGIAVRWVGNAIPRAPTSSYAGEAPSLFYGADMARMLKGLLAELIFGNVGSEMPTYARCDNSGASYQVDSANTVTSGKRLNGLLDRNRGGLGEMNV